MSFLHLHAHSHFSVLDGMSPVERMVEKVVSNGQPGMALTDHGTMSGVFKLYKGMRKADLLPFPGVEAYIISDYAEMKTAKRYHCTMFAFNNEGYEALIKLVSMSHTRETYHFKPLLDWPTLMAARDAGALDGIFATTGCWFGFAQQAVDEYVTENPDDATWRSNAYRPLVRRIKFMRDIFPNLHVEIQHHSQPNDSAMVDMLTMAAHRLSLPLVITQDSHYCDKKMHDLHDTMKELAYGGDPGDVGFPGDSYHLASTDWVKSHYYDHPGLWDEAMTSMKYIADSHDLKIPYLDKYQYHVPQIVRDPLKTLRRKITAGMAERLSRGRTGAYPKAYRDAVEYEMGIIETLGMADYFLLVLDVCEFMDMNDIFYSCRGSANGSIVCWLIGITDIDPLKWNLTFDRFMSLDRERPPDIDIDVERDRREEVAEYVFDRFESMHIGTYLRMGVDEEGNGAIFRSFMSSMRRQLGAEYKESEYAKVKSMDDLVDIRGGKYVRHLYGLGQEVIYRSPGVHAAGLLLGTDDHPLHGQMPTMFIPSSGKIASMMMMEDVEDGGWIKLDLLGSATMGTIHTALELAGMESWHDIPDTYDDPKVYELLRKGQTGTGIFQLEGYTNAKGCKEMKVQEIDDLIVCNALYRPATINAGHKDSYLANRRDPRKVRYIHDSFEPVLRSTYGLPVFQEQVMGMLRVIGFNTVDLNRMLKAIKMSNELVLKAQKTFADLHTTFMDLCRDAGFTSKQATESWDFIRTFSEYSFNRSHSTGYGLIGYYTAWLKVNHPLEFHTALLQTWAGTEKESVYVGTTRASGVRILAPDVNVSGANFSIDRTKGVIRRGLLSIKGVGASAAMEIAEHRPYTTVEQLIEATDSRKVTGGKTWPTEKKGVLAALESAGALKSIMEGDE